LVLAARLVRHVWHMHVQKPVLQANHVSRNRLALCVCLGPGLGCKVVAAIAVEHACVRLRSCPCTPIARSHPVGRLRFLCALHSWNVLLACRGRVCAELVVEPAALLQQRQATHATRCRHAHVETAVCVHLDWRQQQLYCMHTVQPIALLFSSMLDVACKRSHDLQCQLPGTGFLLVDCEPGHDCWVACASLVSLSSSRLGSTCCWFWSGCASHATHCRLHQQLPWSMRRLVSCWNSHWDWSGRAEP
jgi:hypothetical protein